MANRKGSKTKKVAAASEQPERIIYPIFNDFREDTDAPSNVKIVLICKERRYQETQTNSGGQVKTADGAASDTTGGKK